MIYMAVKPPHNVEEVFRRVSRKDMIEYLDQQQGEAERSHISDQRLFAQYVDNVFHNMTISAQSAASKQAGSGPLADVVVAISPIGQWERGPASAFENEWMVTQVREAAFSAMQSYVDALMTKWPDLARRNNNSIF